ncbi:hypothetical protein F9L16_08715 [Agarivorans sp. B2Z047]|uniref:ricin-type beta-trefoil lectin domain protein n=1 Tax=Agarivorans sp. B2Z047 TaxID=2652721 RepID=UPI00128BDA5B|nr:ricin-type beta-trefoil lectin domain protein [Agarivorans sp. B2Z047]MPW29076.1 hypothetical protein [Agarivorans sp. B2Z047]UQN41628.1 ricin-type beta-trefoil lectin domain protein [Agarivorans sp. B2Z047]
MIKSITGLALLLSSSWLLAAAPSVTQIDPNRDRFNDIYYMQQHNTQDYSNQLTDWLNYGFGAVELDVIDRGQWENEALGPYVSHSSSPGKRNCSGGSNTRLGDCFNDIKQWIDRNNPNFPVVVLVDMKVSWDPANAWNHDEVALLDEWMSNHLGSYQYRFSNYLQNYLVPKARQANSSLANSPAKNVRALSNAYGWPLIKDMRGKIVVALTGGKIGSKNQNFRSGWDWLWNNRGVYPASFMCPEGSTIDHVKVGGSLSGISRDDSQRFICNNMAQTKHYQEVANEVANNKQMMHLWGTSPAAPDSFEYNYAAVAHGVQFINREKNTPQQHTTWNNSIPLVGVRRSIPGFFQLYNAQSQRCLAVKDGSYRKGAALVNETCRNTASQQFVYTAESQLRPKGNASYCVDVDGGRARNGAKLHLWTCDGGDSERWLLKQNGSFTNKHSSNGGNSGNGFCMDTNNGGLLTQYHLYSCNNYNANTRFELRPVSRWQTTH